MQFATRFDLCNLGNLRSACLAVASIANLLQLGVQQPIECAERLKSSESRLCGGGSSKEYQAIHNQSLARIALWEAKLDLAQSKLRRSESLIKSSAISQDELDESVSAAKEAEASGWGEKELCRTYIGKGLLALVLSPNKTINTPLSPANLD